MAIDDSSLGNAKQTHDISESEVSTSAAPKKTVALNSVDTGSLKKVRLAKLKRNLSQTIKSMSRDGKFHIDKDLSHLGVGFESNPTLTNLLLTAVTEALIHEGLWKDEAEEMALSEAFPASQTNQERALILEKQDPIEVEMDFDASISMNNDSAKEDVEDDEDDNQSEMSGELFFEPEVKEEAHPIEAEESGFSDDFYYYPKLSQPQLHNLMRERPQSLYQRFARTMEESHYFNESLGTKNLLPAACFYARNILDQDAFKHLWHEVYENGRFHVTGKQFHFEEYLEDIKILKPKIDTFIGNYFLHFRWLRKAVRTHLESTGDDPEGVTKRQVNEYLKKYWERYSRAWESLTTKQKNALELIYISDEPTSYSLAAQQLQISKDSFQDRVNGAKKKFIEAFPEFKYLPPTPATKHEPKLLYGLFWKDKAEKVSPLFREDQKTKLKFEIEPHPGGPVKRKDVDVVYIQSRAIVASPVPDFCDIELFCGLYSDGHFRRSSSGEKPLFKGSGPSAQKIHKKLCTDLAEKIELD